MVAGILVWSLEFGVWSLECGLGVQVGSAGLECWENSSSMPHLAKRASRIDCPPKHQQVSKLSQPCHPDRAQRRVIS